MSMIKTKDNIMNFRGGKKKEQSNKLKDKCMGSAARSSSLKMDDKQLHYT